VTEWPSRSLKVIGNAAVPLVIYNWGVTLLEFYQDLWHQKTRPLR